MPQQHPAPGSEIALQGAVNFRELGGYPAADGRTVRYGLLYRGGNMDALRTPADRAALHLYYYEASSTEEIARMTGQRPGTVRARLSRAREKLRRLLAEEE